MLGLGLAFLFAWDVYFTSDYALIGLMAKHFNTTGELPLYVWRTGYMGTLADVPLAALFTRILGYHPSVLMLGSFVYFVGFVFAFRWAMRAWHGSERAERAVFFLLLATPFLYGKLVRPQPNYSAIYALGCIAIACYGRLFFNKKQTRTRDSFLLGLALGFGLYLYGQIFYFIAAIAAHFGITAMRRLAQSRGLRLPPLLWNPSPLVPPNRPRVRRMVRAVAIGNAIHFTIALLLWISNTQEISIGTHRIRMGAMPMMLASLEVIAGLWAGLWLLAGMRSFRKPLLRSLLAGAAGWCVGIAPKLWYALTTIEPAYIQTSGFQAHFTNTVRNFGYAITGLRTFLGFGAEVSGLATGALIWLAWVALGALDAYTEKRGTHRSFRKDLSPWAVFPFTATAIFVMTRFIYDVTSMRYYLVIVLFVAWAASTHPWPIRNTGRKNLATKIWLAVVIAHLGMTMASALRRSDNAHELRSLAAWMHTHQLRYGYANYWTAYALSYLSNENIVLEPTSSRFSPHYGPIVAKAETIAYIDTWPLSFTPDANGNLTIDGQRYQIQATDHFRPTSASFLYDLHHQGPSVREAIERYGIYLFVLKKVSILSGKHARSTDPTPTLRTPTDS